MSMHQVHFFSVQPTVVDPHHLPNSRDSLRPPPSPLMSCLDTKWHQLEMTTTGASC
jgi:hypothetical protein